MVSGACQTKLRWHWRRPPSAYSSSAGCRRCVWRAGRCGQARVRDEPCDRLAIDRCEGGKLEHIDASLAGLAFGDVALWSVQALGNRGLRQVTRTTGLAPTTEEESGALPSEQVEQGSRVPTRPRTGSRPLLGASWNRVQSGTNGFKLRRSVSVGDFQTSRRTFLRDTRWHKSLWDVGIVIDDERFRGDSEQCGLAELIGRTDRVR
jgi:hypothetical protein